MSRRWRILALIASLWLLLAGPAAAQDGSVRVLDPDGLLGDEVRVVEQAARELAAEGADVIVVAAGASAGTSRDSAQQFLNELLASENLAPSDQLRPGQILFFVAQDARQTSLFYGQQWREKLDPVEATIQQQQMNPRFADGDLAGGLAAGINAVATTINPPNTVLYVVGGVLAATAAGALAVPMLRKRRAAAETLAGARGAMEAARRAAGAAIADLGRLVDEAEAKARYDQLSYAAADAQQLAEIQGAGLQLFHQAQSVFDAAGEQQHAKATPAAADYRAIAAKYDDARLLAEQAAARIAEAEQLRAQLDARGPASTGPTTRLHK